MGNPATFSSCILLLFARNPGQPSWQSFIQLLHSEVSSYYTSVLLAAFVNSGEKIDISVLATARQTRNIPISNRIFASTRIPAYIFLDWYRISYIDGFRRLWAVPCQVLRHSPISKIRWKNSKKNLSSRAPNDLAAFESFGTISWSLEQTICSIIRGNFDFKVAHPWVRTAHERKKNSCKFRN